MATKTDISYGIIPIRRTNTDWEVFLINQFSKIGNNTYWILPKGHPEAGESAQEAALRELQEETGLVPDRLISSPTFDLQYSFEFEGDKIEKTVIFFIGIITNDTVKLDPVEVKEAGWFALEAAHDRLDYRDTKNVFVRARDYIETEIT